MITTIEFLMQSLNETEALAKRISALLQAGDLVALEGDLGAGKSAFARALIREYLGDPHAEVPSPTFTIVQSYEASGKPDIWHADLYRLSDADELYELGLEDARSDGVMLVEWPDRMDKAWRKTALTLTFELQAAADDIEELPRVITIKVPPTWANRLQMIKGSE